MAELIGFIVANFWQILAVILMTTYNAPIAALLACVFMYTNGDPNIFLLAGTFIISFTQFPLFPNAPRSNKD